jgi:hypothetical protein
MEPTAAHAAAIGGWGTSMAHIVPFRTGTAREMAEAGPDGGAEIIIFPGVRRERHVEAPDEGPRQRREVRPERDLLVLLD